MPAIDFSVVKSYDIRGIYGEQLDAKFAYLFGRALPLVVPGRKVAVGRDCRLGSPELYAAVATGLREAGLTVEGLGLCPTELVYFASGRGRELGVMVTASHNPPEYCGFKIVGPGAAPVSGDTGLRAACELMAEMEDEPPAVFRPPGATVDLARDYLDFALALAGEPEAAGMQVVVDASNGVAGPFWEPLARYLGVDLRRLNWEPDGRFPGHPPDPSKSENLAQAIRATESTGADLGLVHDGDADRVVAILPEGRTMTGGETICLIAERLAQTHADPVFGLSQTVSRGAFDFFESRGLNVVMLPVGHSKIKRIMRDDPRILFAGEDASHYYYRDFYCCDSSLLTVLHLLHLTTSGGLAEAVRVASGGWLRAGTEPAFRFERRDEALAACRDAALTALEAYGTPQEMSCEVEGAVRRRCAASDIAGVDSVRADYEDWWFCVRPSGTEPVVRLTVEGLNREAVEARTAELSRLIEQHA